MTEKQCHKCLTQNPENATFCMQCGINIQYPLQKKPAEVSQVLLIIGLSVMFLSTLYWYVIPYFGVDWYFTMRIPGLLINVITAPAYVLIAFSIKEKTPQIIFIVLGALFGLLQIISAFSVYIFSYQY